MENDVTTVLALVVLLSFVLDRVVVGLLFLMSFNNAWSRRFPDPDLFEKGPERRAAERKSKLIYATLAALIGIIVLAGFAHVRILSALGVVPHLWPFQTGREFGNWLFLISFRLLDILVTGLVLTAGADRVAHLMKWFGGKGELGLEPAEPQPIQIIGKVSLEGAGESILAARVTPNEERKNVKENDAPQSVSG